MTHLFASVATRKLKKKKVTGHLHFGHFISPFSLMVVLRVSHTYCQLILNNEWADPSAFLKIIYYNYLYKLFLLENFSIVKLHLIVNVTVSLQPGNQANGR